jgi:membrane protein DedA with SNARE-associated domain
MYFLLDWLAQYGYPLLFGLLVLGIVGLPVPDETLLTFCGYLIYRGKLHPALTFLAGLSGSGCGICISYYLGRRFGTALFLRLGKYVGIRQSQVSRSERLFRRFGPILLTVGYFIPGVRHFTAVVAGMAGLSMRRFAAFAWSGAVLWVGTFLTLGYLVGERWEHTSQLVHRYSLIGLAGLVLVSIGVWLTLRSKLAMRE